MLTYHRRCSLAFTWEQFYKKNFNFRSVCSGITLLKWLLSVPQLPDVNELIKFVFFPLHSFQSDTTEAQLMVSHTGNIIYLPYTVYKFQGTIVSPSVYRVAAELGSWTYDVTKVNLKVVEKDGAGLDEFMEGPVWSLSSQGVTMTSKDYGTPDSPQVFVGAKYLMDVTKKSS